MSEPRISSIFIHTEHCQGRGLKIDNDGDPAIQICSDGLTIYIFVDRDSAEVIINGLRDIFPPLMVETDIPAAIWADEMGKRT